MAFQLLSNDTPVNLALIKTCKENNKNKCISFQFHINLPSGILCDEEDGEEFLTWSFSLDITAAAAVCKALLLFFSKCSVKR